MATAGKVLPTSQVSADASGRVHPNCVSRGLAFEVEGEEALEDLGVGEVGGPVVGGEDGGVEGGVGVVEPGGSLVVQVGEGPLFEFGGIEAGRVEPAVAQLDEAAGGLPTLSRCSSVGCGNRKDITVR